MACVADNPVPWILRLGNTHTSSWLVQVYCLPEGYEVAERSLDDIRYVLNPTFTAEEVSRLDQVR